MSFKKRILKHERTQKVLSWVLAIYIRFVFFTSSKHYIFDAEATPYMSGECNAIFAFWHGRMMMCPTVEPQGRKMHVLISFHRDGKLISDIIAYFGEATISGSSSKGGASAVKEILRALKKGDNVSVTPDGPRGPVYVAEMGVITIAKLSGKPLIPVTFSASRHKRMRSWDRFMLAYPFGRIVFCAGAPILISRDTQGADEEQDRLSFEQAMNQLVDQADGALRA
jgi:lysophospholipid acyltransferase (LPLAT)-like uncharacterized protein